jgi:hypothetical protein
MYYNYVLWSLFQFRLQEDKVKFQLNLTIQILLKQGQVELENFQLVLEYSDAVLINKNIIEDLNTVIRVIVLF